MSRPYRLSPAAQRALLDIYAFTRDRWSVAQAERYLAGLREHFQRLAEMPGLGRVTVPGSSVRKSVHEQHTIFYRETPQELEIGRIAGPGQDFERELERYEQYAERQRKRE